MTVQEYLNRLVKMYELTSKLKCVEETSVYFHLLNIKKSINYVRSEVGLPPLKFIKGTHKIKRS